MMKQRADQNDFDQFSIRCQSLDRAFRDIYKRQKAEASFLINRFTSPDYMCNDIQLLADDVGFGKTWVGMIILFSLLNKNNKHPHTLVVTPTRLLSDKWYHELLVFQKKYIKNPREFGIELITSSGQLLERLSTLKSQRTQARKLKTLFSTDESSLIFMAFCLNEYLQTSEFYGNSDSMVVKNIEKWIKNVLKREDAGLFHRFFSQSEIVRWVRFLRNYASVVGYDYWLERNASPEKIKLALERRRHGREATFINSIAKNLSLEDNKKNDHSIRKERTPIGLKFLRLAAETMPFLEVYDPKKTSRNGIGNQDKEYLENNVKLLGKIAKKGDIALAGLKWIFDQVISDWDRSLEVRNIRKEEFLENNSSSESLDKFKKFLQRIKVTKKHIELFKTLNPREILDFMRRFDQNIKTNAKHNGFAQKSLFDQSPWVQIEWNTSRPVNWGDFIEDIANELRLGKKIRTPSELHAEIAKRFFLCASTLYSYLQDPPLKEQEYFWNRRKIIHNVFVMYMNDLKKWEGFSSQKENMLREIGKPIQLTIVDEAHNWINKKRGAVDYGDNWSKCVEKTLLMTATPLQLTSKNLQQIFDSVKDPMSWPEESAYKLLFDNKTSQTEEGLLTKALKKQKHVQDAWEQLDSIDAELLEKKSAELECESGKRLKQKQLKIWLSMKNDQSLRIRELSSAILDFHKFLEEEIRMPLSELVMKNRSKKDRSYLCGKDILVKRNSHRDHLYPITGLPNSASLFNFICMRLSSIGNRRDKGGHIIPKNPKLMLGLPSSYEALLESQVSKSLTTTETTYKEIYQRLINEKQNELRHPKVEVVSNIVFNNLVKKGEKTLVFCERLETVRVLKRHIESDINVFFDNFIDKEQLIRIYQTIEKKVCEQSDSEENHLSKILEMVSQRVFSKVFPKQSWQLPTEQKSYDIRPYLTISYVYSQLRKKGIQGLPEAYANLTQEENNEVLGEGGVFDSVSTLTGNSSKIRPTILKSFSSYGLPAVLICTPVSQEGVDMHKFCRQIILHDLNWNPAKLEQRVGRVDRQGSFASVLGESVEVYVPFLANSYDDYQYKRVLERSNLQELVFGRNEMVLNESDENDLGLEEGDYPQGNYGQPNLANIRNLIRGLFDMDLSLERLKKAE